MVYGLCLMVYMLCLMVYGLCLMVYVLYLTTLYGLLCGMGSAVSLYWLDKAFGLAPSRSQTQSPFGPTVVYRPNHIRMCLRAIIFVSAFVHSRCEVDYTDYTEWATSLALRYRRPVKACSRSHAGKPPNPKQHKPNPAQTNDPTPTGKKAPWLRAQR